MLCFSSGDTQALASYQDDHMLLLAPLRSALLCSLTSYQDDHMLLLALLCSRPLLHTRMTTCWCSLCSALALLSQAGFNTNTERFTKNLAPILIFAVIGTTLSTFFIGGGPCPPPSSRPRVYYYAFWGPAAGY